MNQLFNLIPILIISIHSHFQEAPIASDPPEDPAAEKGESSSLDELLGIESGKGDRPVTDDESKSDLITESEQSKVEDLLNERSLQENLDSAISDMQLASQIIGRTGSTGIDVQRVQEEIMSRLDAVIEEAMRRQQEQMQSSSSSQEQPQDSQSEPGDVPQQSDQSGQEQSEGEDLRNSQGEGSDQSQLTRRESESGMMLEESDVEWGNLPERMRNILRQGLRESVSRMYQELTESYYRRIAEDASE